MLGLIRAVLFFLVMLKSTQTIHMVMFNALMRAPGYFFDTNSIGMLFVYVQHTYKYLILQNKLHRHINATGRHQILECHT